MIDKDTINLFQQSIINWAKNQTFNYPWRKNRTPYTVLVSEIFLIRTKANQVAPIFTRFIREYPTIKKLENITYEELFSHLKSLGLRNRIDRLVKICNQINIEYNSEIPHIYKDLISLKGIGEYCASAILCFGYNERKELLETNFIRIFKRVFNIKSKTKTPHKDKFLWDFSRMVLPSDDYIKFNYAIIDFGKLICTPKNQKCDLCPLTKICYCFNNK